VTDQCLSVHVQRTTNPFLLRLVLGCVASAAWQEAAGSFEGARCYLGTSEVTIVAHASAGQAGQVSGRGASPLVSIALGAFADSPPPASADRTQKISKLSDFPNSQH
jgi:hypothetical protein